MKFLLPILLFPGLLACDAWKKKARASYEKEKSKVEAGMEGMSKKMQAKIKKHCSGIDDKKKLNACISKIKK